MGHAVRLAVVLSVVFSHAAAQAQRIYMCKDEAGHTLTSDRPIPECDGRAIREFDKNGMVRREIPAPLTPEQKRQQQFEDEKRKAEVAIAEDRKRQDRAILARYRSEADVEAARKQTLEMIQDQIKRDKVELVNAERQQKQVLADVDIYKRKNAPVPTGVKQRIEGAERVVDMANQSIREHEAEIGQINAKFDATLKRFRELMAER